MLSNTVIIQGCFCFTVSIQIYAVGPEGRSRPLEILHSVNTTRELKYLIFVNTFIW